MTFFTLHTLDILCITESWIHSGDLNPFTELMPWDVTFQTPLSYLVVVGGLATAFEDTNFSRCLSTGTVFKFSCFNFLFGNPLVFAIIYPRPNENKDFIN